LCDPSKPCEDQSNKNHCLPCCRERKMWHEMMEERDDGEEDDGGETEEKKGRRDCIYTCHFAPVPKSRGDVTAHESVSHLHLRFQAPLHSSSLTKSDRRPSHPRPFIPILLHLVIVNLRICGIYGNLHDPDRMPAKDTSPSRQSYSQTKSSMNPSLIHIDTKRVTYSFPLSTTLLTHC
jgi:hypothetical protein